MRAVIKKMYVRRPLCAVCILMLLAVYIISGRAVPRPCWDVDALNKSTVTACGTVEDIQYKNQTIQVFIKKADIMPASSDTKVNEKKTGFAVYFNDEETVKKYIRLGCRIQVKGVFEPYDLPMNEGQFDSRGYYTIRGYDGRIKNAELTHVSMNMSPIRQFLRNIRKSAEEVLYSYFDDEDAGVLSAMLLGDKTGIDEDIKELYQRAGISHVLALSGLHIAAIGIFLQKLLKKIGLGNLISSLTAGCVLALYGIMTGMSVSTIRAIIMFLLSCAAAILNRTYDLLSAAALSAVTIILIWPQYLYDSGFLMSFGAIVGIGFVYPVLEDLTDSFLKKIKIPSKIQSPVIKTIQSFCISLSVMIVILPVNASSYFQISRYSFILNLIVIPLMSLVLATGFTGIIIFTPFVNSDGSLYALAGFAAGIILKITELILHLYKALCGLATSLRGNLMILGKPEKWKIYVYAAVTAVVFFYMAFELNRQKVFKRQHKACKIKAWKYIICLIAYLAAFILMCSRNRDDLEIRNIYVGQGDCTIVTGRNMPVIMIDGGSTDTKEVGKYRILPALKANGISRVDYCFLTHLDADHINGVMEILNDPACGVRISNVVLSASYLFSEETDKEETIAAILENSKILSIKTGDSMTFKDIKIECLSPDETREYDGNDASIVLRLTYDHDGSLNNFRALFMGDASSEIEEDILGRLYKVNYLKVGHHGSRTSTGSAFVDKTDPDIAVISAGLDNSYGHPHAETLMRLSDCKSLIYKTMEEGEIITKYNGDNSGKCRVITIKEMNE